MSDNKKFHEFALQSILFKGRSDWYFCFLKSERIAQVLCFLSDSVQTSVSEELRELCKASLDLPSSIAHFAAGEVDAPMVLADIFSLLSAVRIAGVRGLIVPENATIIAKEYELLAERLTGSVHPSPFVSGNDFEVPEFEQQDMPRSLQSSALGMFTSVAAPTVKDNKGHSQIPSKGQKERSNKILDFIKLNKGVSIKDICRLSDPAIRNCSEKTVQRELGELIRRGLIKKVGERRWSLYLPV